MSHTVGIRRTQKLRTRQALLDAALGLLEHQSLSGLGLREVTRAAGVTPTAFYRHFDDTAALGAALVEEALGSLHGTLRAIVDETRDGDERLERGLELIIRHVSDQPAHFRFIAREQHGGVKAVRDAIAAQLRQFGREVAEVLAEEPESRGWSEEDLLMLGGLHVDHLVITTSALLEAGPDREREVAEVARRRLRLIALGRRHWLDRAGDERTHSDKGDDEDDGNSGNSAPRPGILRAEGDLPTGS
ncbi:TetR family transcriptional regulator [Streptomyces sp. NPDC002164]|uniref:TetR family transcriptional regulator n=1 Tax=Streptomyces sp. NPDC002164 TaxID=3364633 RepID=UPI0036AB9079